MPVPPTTVVLRLRRCGAGSPTRGQWRPPRLAAVAPRAGGGSQARRPAGDGGELDLEEIWAV